MSSYEIILPTGLLGAPCPTAFTADTRNETNVPEVKPVTVTLLLVERPGVAGFHSAFAGGAADASGASLLTEISMLYILAPVTGSQ